MRVIFNIQSLCIMVSSAYSVDIPHLAYFYIKDGKFIGDDATCETGKIEGDLSVIVCDSFKNCFPKRSFYIDNGKEISLTNYVKLKCMKSKCHLYLQQIKVPNFLENIYFLGLIGILTLIAVQICLPEASDFRYSENG
jgi:hypothetical protein